MSKRKRSTPRPAGATGARPMVAIVGRPNVGKSTLFNRLARQRIAIVEDVPGVTRDRHYADAWALGREYVLVDTGGFDPGSDDPMKEGIAHHVRMALEECDAVVCCFDGTTELLESDLEAVKLLRGAGKPVIFVANKADSQSKAAEAMGIYELGIEKLLTVSALHGRHIGRLEEAIFRALPPIPENPAEEPDLNVPRVAIVGRPNAGKSSLVNRFVGQDQQLVDNRPGTTVDSVDTYVERKGQPLILIDTAGMRRKKKVGSTGVEALSVFQAIRAMERSHVVVIMVDAKEGVGEQDAKIAGLAVDRGRAVVIVLNKIDLMNADEIKAARTRAKEVLHFCSWAPMIMISAKTGRAVDKLVAGITKAVDSHRQRVTTGELNRFFEEVLERHPPPTQKQRSIRLYYVTQASIAPPTFVAVTNFPDYVHFSYQRYVQNQIRERFGFEGSPIRVRYRGRKKKEKKA